jgi:N-acetyl-beta-hexosaminidase
VDHAVIPAPARFEAGAGPGFEVRPGTAVAYAETGITPIVERFCARIARRTGLRLVPVRGGDPLPGGPSVRIELAAGGEPAELPAPAGLSPAGGHAADERYSLAIDAGQVAVRAAEPAGVARALTTLIQLVATAPAAGAGEIRVPGARILDAPRYAWRGLSLDVARTFFTVGEIRRVIDLASYVQRLRRLVRTLGKRPLGWQESARAGLEPDDIIQYWLTDIDLAASVPPEVRAQLDAELALARRDVEAAVAASVPVIVSPLPHCYLDIPYAEPPADTGPADTGPADRQGRVGLRLYAPKTVAASFGWEPAEALGSGRAAQVAGVEAAIWAETITGFDDLTFLLLPRLAGVAHQAWSAPRLAGWPAHRDRLARHGRLWSQDGLTWFRASTVDWT